MKMLESVGVDWDGRVQRVKDAKFCLAASTEIAANRWSASASRGIVVYCVRVVRFRDYLSRFNDLKAILIKIPLPAICSSTCNREHGYCEKPGECRCRTGWMGEDCGKCHAYPGCKHGTCRRPWECNCKPGWGGFLCDEQMDYCEKNPKTCLNGGKCTSQLKEDGEFKCECPTGYRGKQCETAPAMLMKVSTSSTTSTTTTTEQIPVKAEEEMDEEEQEEVIDEAMQEPENAPSTRDEEIPGESVELEDIDNEAL